jgi:hypothetical protein
MIRNFFLALFGLIAICFGASADSITLTLAPSDGIVSGLPGSTVGWGYSIQNGSDDYLLVENSYFCAGAENPLFTTCSPSLGGSTYDDFIASNLTEVTPGGEASQSFDANTDSGVGEYNIAASATPGQSDTGSVAIVYDLFTTDPLSASYSCCQVGGDMELSAPAEVVVAGKSAIPEPRLAILLGFALAALIVRPALKRSAAVACDSA